MVGVAWCLLIASVYFCYRVILDRHSATHRLLTKVSSEYTAYYYERTGVVFSKVASYISGVIKIGDDNHDFSKVSAEMIMALKKEREETVKRMEDVVTEGKNASKESAFAKLALAFTMLAVGFLCLFTILSLGLLF